MVAIVSELKAHARSLGFDLVGIASAEPFVDAERAMVERIEAGLFRGLDWFTADRARFVCDPRSHFPTARSIVSLGVSYLAAVTEPAPADGTPRGVVARYGWGEDYHRVIGDRLKLLVDFLVEQGAARCRTFVDTGRLPDRAVAARAGLGWFGKNTNILTRRCGSWIFLAEVLTDLDLHSDEPLRATCGRCTRCIDACPTRALAEPSVLDNTLCISFLTIELRGSIPRVLRTAIGPRVFGCDICQDVCPVNRKAETGGLPDLGPARGPGPMLDLLPLLALTEDEFRRRFRGTSIMRAKRLGLLRNAAVALGNLGDPAAIPALAAALADPESLVRGHAAWALGRIGGRAARVALEVALPGEADAAARDEITQALT